jgi:hypothetical protein
VLRFGQEVDMTIEERVFLDALKKEELLLEDCRARLNVQRLLARERGWCATEECLDRAVIKLGQITADIRNEMLRGFSEYGIGDQS